MKKSSPDIYINFDGRQVAVYSNAPEVLAGVERRFEQMLAPEPGNVVGRLQAHWNGQTYHFLSQTREAEYSSQFKILRRLDYEIVTHLVKFRPDMLWFHAGAAACRGKVAMFLGMSGHGKSTLTTKLYTKGWTYLSDDVLPLDPISGRVTPFPQTPRIRKDQGQEISHSRLHQLDKTEISLNPKRVCQETMPVGAIIFPQYNLYAPTGLSICSPAMATVEMLQHCINFVEHRGAAMRHLSNLLVRCPAFYLSFNNASLAADLIIESRPNWSDA